MSKKSPKMTLKQWEQSGGPVPVRFRGREHIWRKMVDKYAAGGEVYNTEPDMSDGGRLIDGPAFQAGGFAKIAKGLIGKASESAGMKAPVTAAKDLTTLQDTYTSLGDRVRMEAELARKMMEGFDYKYDKGQRVFTKDSAAKNRQPYEILDRTRVGNEIMYDTSGGGMKQIKDPETGRAKRTPYEPGYRVRSQQGEDTSEFIIPESAILGDVEMKDGGAAFGVFPQMKGKRSKQDREASKNVPIDLARGFVSGALGAPGDIESLVRLLPGFSERTILPTSEEIEKRLPFRSESPVSQAAAGLGQLGGGLYTGPLSGMRAVTAVPKAAIRAGKDFVMAAPQGAPRMFIGPKAKTWDQAKADAAARMEQAGADPVDIWRQTGTFRGADGILRQEISDVGAVYRNPKELKELGESKRAQSLELQRRLITPIGQKDFWPKQLTEAKKPVREEIKALKDQADELRRTSDLYGHRAEFALEHPELYAAYPELADIMVYQGKRGFGGESAGLLGGKGDMEVNVYERGLRGNPRSSMLHEMQHAVQTLEDFAPGGNPTMAFNDPKAFEILNELRAKASTPMSFDEYTQSILRMNPSKSIDDLHPDIHKKNYEDYVKSVPGAAKKIDRELQSQAAMEYYKRLAGEAEARATQFREGMSPSQRAAEFPYSSYDVAPEDLIAKPAKGTVNALQTVYHGSPHKFEKFDPSKIGTGEGAQAYGHGLYFAESPEVATAYRKNLSKDTFLSPNGTVINKNKLIDMGFHKSDANVMLNALQKHGGDFNAAADAMATHRVSASKFLRSIGDQGAMNKGNLYRVDLPDEKIAKMLDWNKPLSEQHPDVQKALSALDPYTHSSGEKMWGELAFPAFASTPTESHKSAAEWLRQQGIPGIKYLDEQSRGATGSGRWKITMKDGEQKIYDFKPNDDVLEQMGATAEPIGTRNFVVFPGEEDALTILERKKEGGDVHMADGGAAFGKYTTGKKYQGAVKRAKEADVNALKDPRTYAAVMGLLGEAPDQLGFSVMHPDIEGIKRAGEKGFMAGTIAGVAPVVAPLTKGLPVGAAIKPVGGNWLTGNVERALNPLKIPAQTDEDITRTLRWMNVAEGDIPARVANFDKSDPNRALNRWIDRNLTNYVKKQMATPEDPVRKLAEQGIVHAPFENIGVMAYRAPEVRRHYGGERLGESEAARIWEDASDVSMSAIKIKDLRDDLLEPWMSKVDPETKVWSPVLDNMGKDLGFDHIVDVLRQDINAGRIRPEQLNKVSMEQAVRRTHEFDQEMFKKMREAQVKATEGMPVHKEYPEGYRWIELSLPEVKGLPENASFEKLSNGLLQVVDSNGNPLTVPVKTEAQALKHLSREQGQKTLEDALKYEGETMGHCVGGYCPDVMAGRSRIFSLRDAKGEPHVTVEVQKPDWAPRNDDVQKYMGAAEEEAKRLPNGYTSRDIEDIAVRMAKENAPLRIVQIKGKQNLAPKEEYLPYVQDFVKGGQWSDVGDLKNTGLQRITQESVIPGFEEWMRLKAHGNVPTIPPGYYTPQELLQFGESSGLKDVHPSVYELWKKKLGLETTDGMKAGGAVKSDCGCKKTPKLKAGGDCGCNKPSKDILNKIAQAVSQPKEQKMAGGGIPKLLGKLIKGETAEAAATATQRAEAGKKAADLIKATEPMKMSEALGNLNVEGRGKVKVTQSDRTRVGGGNIGGAMFPGLSQVNPLYENLVWGVGKKPTASTLINQSDDLTYWTTILGAADQLKTNPIVFNKMRREFTDAMKQGKLSDELAQKINQNIALKFGEGADIRDPKIWKQANTFDKRALLADVMMGQGVDPSKGGVALGGEKSGKGVIFKPTEILKKETEPMLLHPEHGGEVPTFAVGPRLFQLSGDYSVRPDLHPGFPVLLKGEDTGMVFKPAPGEIAMRDFTQRMLKERKRTPGYYEWTMGESGKGLPAQDITEDYLTYLQKAGYAKGGLTQASKG